MSFAPVLNFSEFLAECKVPYSVFIPVIKQHQIHRGEADSVTVLGTTETRVRARMSHLTSLIFWIGANMP